MVIQYIYANDKFKRVRALLESLQSNGYNLNLINWNETDSSIESERLYNFLTENRDKIEIDTSKLDSLGKFVQVIRDAKELDVDVPAVVECFRIYEDWAFKTFVEEFI